ncbi:aminotransferase [Rhodococcus zopfii]|uniref:hypothetical protein n=1 Tax=Rhodococcus zopfii TaxID=43772 RepID=UPI0009325824|nr:hypothetical protein [Rhodococcus zopfii]
MAVSNRPSHPGEDSVPVAPGFLQLFMEANRLAGRAHSSEQWVHPAYGDGAEAQAGGGAAGDRRPR